MGEQVAIVLQPRLRATEEAAPLEFITTLRRHTKKLLRVQMFFSIGLIQSDEASTDTTEAGGPIYAFQRL